MGRVGGGVMVIIGCGISTILAHVVVSKSTLLELVVGVAVANTSVRLAHLGILRVIEEGGVVLHSGHSRGETTSSVLI